MKSDELKAFRALNIDEDETGMAYPKAAVDAAIDELKALVSLLKNTKHASKVKIDMSLVSSADYYGGVIFKGFINGIPDSVLSGGRYDRVMEKFGKKTNAIGFAVYLDKLERFGNENRRFDVDVMLCYDDGVKSADIIKTVNRLIGEGKTVKTVSAPDKNTRCRQLVRLTKEGVETIEAND